MRSVRTPEAAKLLGVAPATLEKWRYERPDGPPYRKLGAVVVYDLAELEAWAAQHTVAGPQRDSGSRSS
jgi:predicted DNA-binding transcriptional regulator AlpA